MHGFPGQCTDDCGDGRVSPGGLWCLDGCAPHQIDDGVHCSCADGTKFFAPLDSCLVPYDCLGDFDIALGALCLACPPGWFIDATLLHPLCVETCEGDSVVLGTG